jgi:hypothetical protein
MQILDPKRATKLNNLFCPYCGQAINISTSNEDHVIARRFVPKCLLENRWNLILRSCVACNTNKSKLEDDISAISLVPTFGNPAASQIPPINNEILRKARGSKSARTNRKVIDSYEEIEVNYTLLEDVKIRIGLIGPPQVNEDRILALNHFHLNAFSYFLTYDYSSSRGYWLPGQSDLINIANFGDWGNVRMRKFMMLTEKWTSQFDVTTADGFFKVRISKNPDAEIWSWALEYNKNIRSVGTIGKPSALDEFYNLIPQFNWSPWFKETVESKQLRRQRLEVPISDIDDILFK